MTKRRSTIRTLLLTLLLGGTLAATGARAEGNTLLQTAEDGTLFPLILIPCGPVTPPIPGTATGEAAIELRDAAVRLSVRPVVAGDDAIELVIELDLTPVPAGTPVTVGLDVRGVETRVTTATPPMVGGGAAYGTSANFLRGSAEPFLSTAIVATDQGDIPLAGRASLRMGGGPAQVEIAFPIADLPAGIDSVRPAFVFGTMLCGLLGDPAVDDGYLPAATIDTTLQQHLDDLDGAFRCSAAASSCLLLPADLQVTPTGEGTFDVVYQGLNFGGQFSTSGGGADDILGSYRSAGWTLENPVEIASPHRTWQGFDLTSGGRTLGTIAVSDNGSSTNPAVFAVTVLGPAGLTPEQLDAAAELRSLLANGFNSAFELFP